MNTDTKTRMTVDEFVTWCDARARQWRGSDEPGWELFDGEPVMQDSERWAHGRVKANLFDALRSAVSAAGLPYAISIDSLGIRIDERTATKPDAVVFPAGLIGDDDRFAPEPIIVAEVLSPSTTKLDLTTKLAGYSRVETIAHYLVLDPDASELIHYRRVSGTLMPPDAPATSALALDPPGIAVHVDNCFKR
jgi:Uma2 family endonuclease